MRSTSSDLTARAHVMACEGIHCPCCRYDLAACASVRCPECGWTIRLVAQPPVGRRALWLGACAGLLLSAVFMTWIVLRSLPPFAVQSITKNGGLWLEPMVVDGVYAEIPPWYSVWSCVALLAVLVSALIVVILRRRAFVVNRRWRGRLAQVVCALAPVLTVAALNGLARAAVIPESAVRPLFGFSTDFPF